MICERCGMEKHYTHFPLQDADLIIVRVCGWCLTEDSELITAPGLTPNRGWGENNEAALEIAKARYTPRSECQRDPVAEWREARKSYVA